MDIEREAIQRDPATGSVETVHTQQHIASEATVERAKADRTGAYIWYVVGVIDILLFIRMIFLVFGANDTGFASLVYTITHPFMSLFAGIFPTQSSTTGYFDTASLLAVAVYTLLGWGIVALIEINKKGKVA